MLTDETAKKSARRRLDRVRQLHAADLVVLRRGEHARSGIRRPRFLRRGGQDHLLAVEARLFRVDEAVERRVLLARDPLARFEHGVERLARVVGKTGARIQLIGVQPVVKEEVDGGSKRGHQRISNTPAAPIPPPMHIVTTTFFAPRRLPSISA
jgi:hypothetical protein